MLKRTITAIAATGAVLASAGAASAAPTTYCVDAKGCDGTPAASLQGALDDAQKSPDPDRIEIGAGSYFPGPGSFTYSGSSKNTVTIAGAGAGETHIYATTATHDVLSLNYADVSDLEVIGTDPATKAGAPAALALAHGTGTRLKLVNGVTGALLKNEATLASSQVTGSGARFDVGAAVHATGADTTVVDSTLHGPGRGVWISQPSASVSVIRCRIHAQTGVDIDDGLARVTDSLLEGPAQDSGAALRLAGNGTDQTATVTGTTIVYPAPVGIGVLTEPTGASTIDVSVTNSVVVAGNWAFIRDAASGSMNLNATHSAFDPAKVHDSGGPGFLNLGDASIAADPAFVDASAHDYRLRSDSPLIDKGTPTPSAGLGSADLGGGKRSLDGDGDGVAVPDIGAFEAPAVPPTGGTGDPKPPIGQPDLAPVLSQVTLTHKRFKVRKRATTFRFKLSEPAAVTIKIGKRKLVRSAHGGLNRLAFNGRLGARALKPGRYVARLTARDSAGHASKTRQVSFRVV